MRFATIAWAAVAAAALASAPFRALRSSDATDFVAFYTATHVLAQSGGTHLYSLSSQAATQISVLGHPLSLGLAAYGDPPLVAWLLQPFGSLPFKTALLLFTLSSIVATFIGSLGLAAVVTDLAGNLPRIVVAVAIGVLIPLADAVAFANVDGFVFAAAACGVYLLVRNGDNARAGAVLGICGMKPQAVWLLPLFFLSARAWRTLAGLAAMGSVWILSFPLIVGFSGISQWFYLLGHWFSNEVSKSASIPGFLVAHGMRVEAGIAGATIVAAVGCGVMFRRWSVPRLAPLTAIGLALSSLLAAHAFAGDVAVGVGIGLVLTYQHRPWTSLLVSLSLGLIWLTIGSAIGSLAFLLVACLAVPVIWRFGAEFSAPQSSLRGALRQSTLPDP